VVEDSASSTGTTKYSAYRLRLFQMMPILEVLDEDRAESLLQEDTETQAARARYPQGMQSLDPGHQDTLAEKRESRIWSPLPQWSPTCRSNRIPERASG
jgi:hypothetical protein